ncbi:MAG: RagB/SusD family nutrient uptake outer membrane protein [Cyclobacteriaceae bacterium]|nr:RagB/SusD family nutrient uptake outer membrane protein [Cyclobacteriaceae bacterium]
MALTVLLIGASCTDLLDLQPQTALSDATAFSTPERVELAVAGVYDAAQSGTFAGNVSRGYPFGAAHIQQGDNRGEDVFNVAAFYQITYQSTFTPATANNDWHWINLFRVINRANVVLAGLETAVPTSTMTQAVIDSYKGECRFIRALSYHELLKHFCKPFSDNPDAALGGMPLRSAAVTSASTAAEAVGTGRSTVRETYDFVLADLNYAESVLPENRANTSLKISRATKGAAVAFKTRVYLHMGRWTDVITEANKLVPQATAPFSAPYGGYSLPANPFAAFTSAGSKNNSESIFSIEHSAEDNAGVNGGLASMYNTNQAPINGRALVAISPLIWNQPWFLSTDARKGDTFVFNAQPAGGTAKGGRFTRKYSDVAGLSDNAPHFRYAEVMLNLAEAIQRNAPGSVDARAFALYNAIRSRSVADPATDEITDFASANALIQAILNERRIEFICEGLRWGDVHRLAQDATFNSWGGGIPSKVNTLLSNISIYYTGDPATNTEILTTPALNHAAIPYTDNRFLWPIPNSELTLNPVLAQQQNPGW